jgi:hypothetical protein
VRSTSVHLRWGTVIAGARHAMAISQVLAESIQIRFDLYANTLDAVSALQRRKPRIVLVEAARLANGGLAELQAVTRRYEIPLVILLSPDDTLEPIQACANVHVLPAEWRPDALVEVVRRCLHRGPIAAGGSAAH